MENYLQNSQRQEQGLLLTPAQKRSLEILQKPSLELQKYLAHELDSNPLLEVDETDYTEKPQTVGESGGDDFDDDSAVETPADPDYAAEQSKRDFALNSQPDAVHLGEALVNEGRINAESESVARAFETLVEHLDSRGFLAPDILDNLHTHHGVATEDAEKALEMLHECEPAGIGARGLRECFLLQLARNKDANPFARKILEEHFDLFLKRRVDEIAKLENRSTADVEDALDEIAKLSPSPAREFAPEEAEILVPDVEFYFDDGKWRTRLTNEYIPKLRINAEYRQMSASGALDDSAKSYIREKIRDAKSVIDAVAQRQSTLLKISEAILRRQQKYFEDGELAPMTRQEIAEDIGVHPTTVSRAISGKNALTPSGVMELKNFFTAAIKTADGTEASSDSAKEKIRDIISDEDPSKPLSDERISELLSAAGFSVARRTVAKYREELGIATKTLRRRF